MSSYATLKIEVAERLATVSMNRPEVRNAFHPTMIRELTLAFRELGSRKDIAAIVLKGEGKSFCSGADLGYMKAMAAFSFDENASDSEQLFEMFWAIRECPLPVIARLHGHVMGGALGLAAVCDLAAAVEGTQFCFSEVRLGLAPAVISPFVLERMASAHARRYMLTGEIFGAGEAFDSGLAQFVGDEASVDAFVLKAVAAFKFNGPEAVRATKALIRAVGETSDWTKRKSMTTQVIAERRVSEEGQEGLRGFLEKREPKWRA